MEIKCCKGPHYILCSCFIVQSYQNYDVVSDIAVTSNIYHFYADPWSALFNSIRLKTGLVQGSVDKEICWHINSILKFKFNFSIEIIWCWP